MSITMTHEELVRVKTHLLHKQVTTNGDLNKYDSLRSPSFSTQVE